MNSLKSGLNRIIYSYAGSGPGHFIEEPGPMFVVRRSSSGGDNQPPAVSNQSPAPGASDVDTETPLTLNLSDGLFGVDFKTVKLKINGNDVSNKMKLDGVSSNYLLSYLPAQDWDYSSQINVTLDACDLAGNCMDTVSYSFTTQDPDTTPPTISNVVVVTRPNGADISWTTDEPATSQIDYGETNQHELGSVDDDALKTEHALEINGLQPDNLYHFQIFSTDNKGNTGKTKDDTFLTDVYPDVSSDDFNACQLDPKWEYIDPIGDTTLSLNGEQAIIEVPGGVIHDWNTGRPPRLMQLANDTDFTIDVKFDNLVNVPIQMQGLLVEESDSTYLYVGFEIITDGTTGLPTLTQFARFIENGSVVKGTRKTITGIANYPIYARISRNGDKWSWYYSSDGQNWTRPALPYTFDMTVLRAGVYAGNTPETSGGSVPANTAVIDYFFNADSPIDPEDGIPNALTLSTNGNGAVAKTPDKEKYACGEEVTISESSDIGWFFDSWSGDIDSTNQAETVVMDGPKSITANFAPIPYLLTVNLVNNGVGGDGNKVTKNPDLPTYTYDDVVELTAVPEPGWVFKEWSGGLTGTELTKSVTMQQDVTATATFEQEQYTLDLQVVHDGIGEGGTVTATPMQDTYVYGDVVALKAMPEPGWTFDGWTGAVTSSDPETELTIMGNSQVTARFVQDQYELNVTIVNDGIGEGGTVSLSPPKATYLYGDVVALVAEAAPGWTFTGWDGALSGDNPVEVLTIKGDTDVTATFAQDNYELDITIEGSGNVKVEPDKPAYLFGDIVTLTAIPAPNLYFGGWGGDLIGAQNPIEITVLGDMQITALFTSNPPPVVSPIPDQTIAINNKVSFNITATDPTNEPLVLTVDGLPAGATFIDNGDGTGSFEWTPSLADRGDYVLTFIASDSEGVGSATMTISVIGYGVAVPVVAGQ
ncbi:MAG: Ig-like domain-containing protein [Chloroflexota bacterium]